MCSMYVVFLLWDKQRGYLRLMEDTKVMTKMENIARKNQDKVPDNRKILFSFKYNRIYKSNIHNRIYWIAEIEAVILAGGRRATHGTKRG